MRHLRLLACAALALAVASPALAAGKAHHPHARVSSATYHAAKPQPKKLKASAHRPAVAPAPAGAVSGS